MSAPLVADLQTGWEVTSSAASCWKHPRDMVGAAWVDAAVPGTAASAVGFSMRNYRDFDEEDWFFRTHFTVDGSDCGSPSAVPGQAAASELVLEFDGIATISQVFLNGELILESSSMWATHSVDVTERVLPSNELVIACRALNPRLAMPRPPRQRWRTRWVYDANVRWYRTMIFGRCPGHAPGPAPVGPWRPVRLVRKPRVGIAELRLAPRLDGDDGVVSVSAHVYGDVTDAEVTLADTTAKLAREGGWFRGEVRATEVAPWWPHTHGTPQLYDLTIKLDGAPVASRRVGFRTLDFAPDIHEDGLDLHVNGVGVFVRGALWTPVDAISLAPTDAELAQALERARDAGMNMLRIPGTGAYESQRFFDLCDELGIMVWQDLMFACLDYPLSDADFHAEVEREARQVLASLSGRPSLAVICANDEVEQQPAMLGLDPALGRHEFWEATLPDLVARYGTDCAFLRSTPVGGDVPFQVNRGISHYFGVGGYFRPLSEVRNDGVRFAAECLTFAHVPDDVQLPTHHPDWKAGVMRDAGPAFQLAPGFDFDDVRDFCMAQLFDVDPVLLRRTDQDRYFELSRATSGEAMAETFGEWRRTGSSCNGAMMMWLKDMIPGAGFGVLDHQGQPKVSYHHLRRALAPVAVWTTDEHVSGIAIHVANDRGVPLRASLRVALYHELRNRVADAAEVVDVPSHSSIQRTVEGMLGRFVDSALAFGFGPPAHDAIVVALESIATPPELISQAVRFPAGRPITRDSAERSGVRVTATTQSDNDLTIAISCERLLYGVTLEIPGFELEDNAFSVEPGVTRTIRAWPRGDLSCSGGSLRALNLSGVVVIAPPTPPSPSTQVALHGNLSA